MKVVIAAFRSLTNGSSDLIKGLNFVIILEDGTIVGNPIYANHFIDLPAENDLKLEVMGQLETTATLWIYQAKLRGEVRKDDKHNTLTPKGQFRPGKWIEIDDAKVTWVCTSGEKHTECAPCKNSMRLPPGVQPSNRCDQCGRSGCWQMAAVV